MHYIFLNILKNIENNHLMIYFNYFVILFVLLIFIVITGNAFIYVICMLYAWESPEAVERYKSLKKYKKPKFSFTALVPARNEERVI